MLCEWVTWSQQLPQDLGKLRGMRPDRGQPAHSSGPSRRDGARQSYERGFMRVLELTDKGKLPRSATALRRWGADVTSLQTVRRQRGTWTST
jgi:hypothetical protein